MCSLISGRVIVVEHGKRARLRYCPEVTAGCSEMVPFPDINKNAKRPTGEEESVEALPELRVSTASPVRWGCFVAS